MYIRERLKNLDKRLPSKPKPAAKPRVPAELRQAAAVVKGAGHKLRGVTDAKVLALASHGLLNVQAIDVDDLIRVQRLLDPPPTEARLRANYGRFTVQQLHQLIWDNLKGKPA